MNSRVCIAFAEGCPRSHMDTGVLFRYFEANGWTITDDPMQADMVLVGTCGFSKQSEEISVNLMTTIVKKNPKATFVAFGCLPGINESALTERFKVKPLVRSNLNQLDEIIGAKVPISKIREVNVLDRYMEQALNVFSPDERKSAMQNASLLLRASEFAVRISPCPHLTNPEDTRGIFNIRVEHGCMSECTYCAIRKASGTVRSKPFEEVKGEFTAGLAEGHRTFRLIGEDVGAYGQDINMSIVDLLSMIYSYKEEFTICWDDFHPRWLLQYSSQLRRILAQNNRRISHIGLPVQSGSDRILKLMKREYTAGEVQDCLSKLREDCPDLRIDTHFLIGFPGETSKDFAQTLKLLEHIGFYRATPFLYTDRPETESINMPGKISVFTKCRRLWQFRMKAAAVIRQRSSEPVLIDEAGGRTIEV